VCVLPVSVEVEGTNNVGQHVEHAEDLRGKVGLVYSLVNNIGTME